MSRSSLSKSAVFSILLLAACDDEAANEQKKVFNAQNEANKKIVAATSEANQKVSSAQTEADKKIVAAIKEAGQKTTEAQLESDKQVAAAKENFMKLREDYRHTIQTNLIELDRKVTGLETKAKQAAGKARAELDARIKQIHARRDTFSSNYKSLETEAASTWDDAKARLDKEWSELKALVDNS